MTIMSRRHLLSLAAASTLFDVSRAQAEPATAPRRAVLSMNMRSSGQVTVQVSDLTTYMATLPLETGATALRIGVANTTPFPYRLGGIAVCESVGWDAAANGAWAYFRFLGEQSDAAKLSSTRPQAFEVPGNTQNATGARNVPLILWSDWLDFATTAGTRRPQLLFRSLVPPQQNVPMAYPAGPGRISSATFSQPERLLMQATVAGDFVTNPNQSLPETSASRSSPVYVIQYRAAVPGFQFVIGGDSQFAMSSTFAQLAATRISTPARPISVWDAAWGKPSNTFWPALDEAISDAPPSISVIQGWTANDGMTPGGDQAYLERVEESAARTLAAGGIPMIVKPLPRNLFGKPELASWKSVDRQLDALVPGALVFDPSPYVEDPVAPGNWISGLSNDGLHPNGRGNLALLGPFERFIMPLLT